MLSIGLGPAATAMTAVAPPMATPSRSHWYVKESGVGLHVPVPAVRVAPGASVPVTVGPSTGTTGPLARAAQALEAMPEPVTAIWSAGSTGPAAWPSWAALTTSSTTLFLVSAM